MDGGVLQLLNDDNSVFIYFIDHQFNNERTSRISVRYEYSTTVVIFYGRSFGFSCDLPLGLGQYCTVSYSTVGTFFPREVRVRTSY